MASVKEIVFLLCTFFAGCRESSIEANLPLDCRYITKLHKKYTTNFYRIAEREELGRLDSLALHSSSLHEPVSSACSPNNGLGPCSTLCLSKSSGYTCACKDGIALLSNRKTCTNALTSTTSSASTAAVTTTTITTTSKPQKASSEKVSHGIPTAVDVGVGAGEAAVFISLTSTNSSASTSTTTTTTSKTQKTISEKVSLGVPTAAAVSVGAGGASVLIVAIVVVIFFIKRSRSKSRAPSSFDTIRFCRDRVDPVVPVVPERHEATYYSLEADLINLEEQNPYDCLKLSNMKNPPSRNSSDAYRTPLQLHSQMNQDGFAETYLAN